ncbi:hypothetical protein L9F63_012653, partial [Diploptera punctata]
NYLQKVTKYPYQIYKIYLNLKVLKLFFASTVKFAFYYPCQHLNYVMVFLVNVCCIRILAIAH